MPSGLRLCAAPRHILPPTAGEISVWRLRSVHAPLAHAQDKNDEDPTGPSQVDAQAAAQRAAGVAPGAGAKARPRWALLAPLSGLVAVFALAMVGVIGRPPAPGDAAMDSFSQLFSPTPLIPHTQS